MSDKPTTIHPLFTLLEGMWTGTGRGEYSTITPFDYRETLTFTRRLISRHCFTSLAMTGDAGRTDLSAFLKAASWS